MSINSLELLYESRIPTIRQNVVESILVAERWENFTEVEQLVKVLNQQEKDWLVQEGFWDRMKARGAGAMGAVKGLGNQIKGAGQQALGNLASGAGNLVNKAYGPNADPTQNRLNQYGQQKTAQGQANIQQGQAQGQTAKLQSYINNSANTIINDFQKLGYQLPDANAARQELIKTFFNMLQPQMPQNVPQQQVQTPVQSQQKAVPKQRVRKPKVGP